MNRDRTLFFVALRTRFTFAVRGRWIGAVNRVLDLYRLLIIDFRARREAVLVSPSQLFTSFSPSRVFRACTVVGATVLP